MNKKQKKVEHVHLTVGLLLRNIELKKETKSIELPGLPHQITKKGEDLSIAKDYFGYKGKRVVVAGAVYQPQLAPNKF